MKKLATLILVWVLGVFTATSLDGCSHTIPPNSPFAKEGDSTSTNTDPTQYLGWLSSAKESTVLVDTSSHFGSGVALWHESESTFVLTAKHVIWDDQLQVPVAVLNAIWFTREHGYSLPAKVVVWNAFLDSAIIEVTDPLKQMKLASFSVTPPKVGDWVIAMGFPGAPPRHAFVTIGKVTSVDGWQNTFEHSASIYFGSSGGPVFNMQGEVISITTNIDMDLDWKPSSERGLARPSAQLREWTEAVRKGEYVH